MYYLHTTTPENGCVRVIPSSHYVQFYIKTYLPYLNVWPVLGPNLANQAPACIAEYDDSPLANEGPSLENDIVYTTTFSTSIDWPTSIAACIDKV